VRERLKSTEAKISCERGAHARDHREQTSHSRQSRTRAYSEQLEHGRAFATFTAATPLGHPLAPILAYWLDNHVFLTATLIGFTVMGRSPTMKVIVANDKASWMHEVLEKMEASTRVIPLLHHYPGQHRA
jgi:hypothetical protein